MFVVVLPGGLVPNVFISLSLSSRGVGGSWGWTVRRRRSRLRGVVVGLVSVAALVAAEPVALAEPAAVDAAVQAKKPTVSSVKDVVAAQVTARAQGARVEVGVADGDGVDVGES